MEIRQLRYFEVVARTLNFSRAAEELFIAQPALSRQIQKLEEELGVMLIDRGSRPLKLTRPGLFFYEQAPQLLARLEELKRATQRLDAENREWIGIGFVPSVLYGNVPRLIQTFSSQNRQIDITLVEMVSAEQGDALKSGRIDLGFGRLAIPDDAVENEVLADESLIAAVSSQSPLARLDKISLSHLVSETLILYPTTPRPNYADQVLRQFKVRGLEVQKTWETNGLQTAVGMAAAGVGVTLVPESVQLLQRPDVTYLPLAETGVTSPLVISRRAGESSEHVLRFLQSIRGVFGR